MQMRCPTDGWRKLPDATGVAVEKAALSRSVCLFRPFFGTESLKMSKVDSIEYHCKWCACPPLHLMEKGKRENLDPNPKSGSGDYFLFRVNDIKR